MVILALSVWCAWVTLYFALLHSREWVALLAFDHEQGGDVGMSVIMWCNLLGALITPFYLSDLGVTLWN